MKAVVFAYHDVGCAGLRVLLSLGVEVGVVYTHEDDPAENRWFGSVREACAELGVPCSVADPHRESEVARIRRFGPDALFSLYYRDLLRDPVLSLAGRGAVNLHGSLLPRYRGRAPVNWMILHGETRGGVTLHHMVRRPDAGDIVDQEGFGIGPDDTAVDVYRRMVPAAERVLRRSARAVLDGSAPRIRQMESKATCHGRRRPEDGLIDWRWCAEDARNLVRAVTRPYPGAFTFAGPTKVLVWRATRERAEDGPAPEPRGGAGRPGLVSLADGVRVLCGDRRLLRLDLVEIDGRSGDGSDFPEVLRAGAVLGGA